jgi:putative transposase
MARKKRELPAGYVYHVGNRGSRKGPLFDRPADFDGFVELVKLARNLNAVRIVSYCLMSNHWHFLLWPMEDDAISGFMHWLTGQHGLLRRRETNTVGEGAVYQSRFWAVPMLDHLHLLAAWRYIERNPVEASLVERAEEWRWSGACPRNGEDNVLDLDLGPLPRPANWLEVVNASYADHLIDYFEE